MNKIDRRHPEPLVKPIKFSHGTLECRDLAKSKRFYTEFLGLECVRHAKRAMLLREAGAPNVVVCVQVGEKIHSQHVLNHWGLDVESREAVDRAHALAEKHKDDYEIRKIRAIRKQHGNYGFYLQDRDENWWEIQYIDPGKYDESFARGDVVAT